MSLFHTDHDPLYAGFDDGLVDKHTSFVRSIFTASVNGLIGKFLARNLGGMAGIRTGRIYGVAPAPLV